MRYLSGIQPSGVLHIGNYFGAIRQHIQSQDEHDSYYFIADYHALTTVRDAEVLRENVLGVALDYLALGLDPGKTTFFRHSEVPEVQELAWVLSTLTPMGLLERCTSYKDKTAKGIAPDHGLFAYPVLMASDILIYDSNRVPVGKDQLIDIAIVTIRNRPIWRVQRHHEQAEPHGDFSPTLVWASWAPCSDRSTRRLPAVDNEFRAGHEG